MSLRRWLVRDITILRGAPATDSRGEAIIDWTAPTSRTVKGWWHQDNATEDLANRDANVITGDLRLPAGDDLAATDRVQIAGVPNITFDVDGAPGRPWDRHGEHHVHARLRGEEG